MTVTHAGQVTARAASGRTATVAGQDTVRADGATGGGVVARARAWRRAVAAWAARWSPALAAEAAGAPVGPAERVLTTCRDRSGAMVVATGAAVYYQDLAAGPGRGWSRRGWEDVTSVGWDDRRGLLGLTGVGPGGVWRQDLALPASTGLAAVARERLTATLLASTLVRVDDQPCAWVSARRRPDTGAVVWVVVRNQPAAAAAGEPAVEAAVAAAVAGLRARTGLPAGGAGPSGPSLGPW